MNLVVTEARALTARASGYRMDFETENFVVARPLVTRSCSHGQAGIQDSDNLVVADTLRGEYGQQSYRGDGADNLIAFDYLSTGTERSQVARAGDYSGSLGAQRTHEAISGPMGVRRLTPLECERLMGWPDDFTRWTADGHEVPDSHRYRLCGNGVVSTVAEWIGHRLMAMEAA